MLPHLVLIQIHNPNTKIEPGELRRQRCCAWCSYLQYSSIREFLPLTCPEPFGTNYTDIRLNQIAGIFEISSIGNKFEISPLQYWDHSFRRNPQQHRYGRSALPPQECCSKCRSRLCDKPKRHFNVSKTKKLTHNLGFKDLLLASMLAMLLQLSEVGSYTSTVLTWKGMSLIWLLNFLVKGLLSKGTS